MSTSMGANGEDVRLSPRTRLPSAVLECKCGATQRVGMPRASRENAPTGTTRVSSSRNRAPTYAVVPWDVLLALYARHGAAESIPPRLRDLLRQLVPFVAEAAPPPPGASESDAGCVDDALAPIAVFTLVKAEVIHVVFDSLGGVNCGKSSRISE